MSKAKTATTDAFFADPFAIMGNEMPETIRAFIEQGLVQGKDGYAKLKNVAEDNTEVLEETFDAARRNLVAGNLKAIEVAEAGTTAAFSLTKSLLGVKSLAEAVELNTAFVRKMVEDGLANGRAFQDFTTKAFDEVTAPSKVAIEKTMATFKAA